MPRERSPSCGRSSDLRRPALVRIREVCFPTEFQERITILRKWHRLPTELCGHASIVEYGVESEIRHKHFHQRRDVPNRASAIREYIDRSCKWLLRKWQIERSPLLLCRRK